GILVNHLFITPGQSYVTLKVTDTKGASASVTKSIDIKQLQPPVVLLKLTSADTGLMPFMAGFDASDSKDPQGQALSFNWDFGDGQKLLSAGGSVSHQYTQEGSYTVHLRVQNATGASSSAEARITVTKPVLPPDPAQVATQLSLGNAQTPFFESVKFLISGPESIQRIADPSIIEDRRASVLRGKLLDSSDAPLAGINVRVNDHPEFGYTTSRSDGSYDMLVNGGGLLTLVFEGAGYLTSSRQVQTSFQDFFFAPDVVLVKLDAKVTPVILGANFAQTASGNVNTDASGSRIPTVYFPSNTSAQLVLPDGTTRSVAGLTFRATEYTVGPNGKK
ncbi:MAG: PKD domain-containing protein, partial [Proteobacteria bacterium]